jgi:hypothetical protein
MAVMGFVGSYGWAWLGMGEAWVAMVWGHGGLWLWTHGHGMTLAYEAWHDTCI